MGSSDQPKGRFAGLRRVGERVDAGQLVTHPEMIEAAPTTSAASGESTLRQRLGGEKPAKSATVRMSVEMSAEMHNQVGQIAVRAGIPKAEVVRQILAETLPDLL